MLQSLAASNVDLATDIIKEYMEIRGFGPVKEAAVRDARDRIKSKFEGYLNITSKAA